MTAAISPSAGSTNKKSLSFSLRALPRPLFYGVLYFLARLFELFPGFFYCLIDFLAGLLDRALFRSAKRSSHQDDHHQPCDDTSNKFLHRHPPLFIKTFLALR
jgi:hypothetical protein